MTGIVLGSVVVFAAGAIQVVTSFGFALLAVPLLSFLFPTSHVVVLVVTFSLVANLFVLVQTRSFARLKSLRWLLFFSVLGIPAGVVFLKLADPVILKALVGAIVALTGILMMTGVRVRIDNEILSSGIAGLLSGFLNGSISMSGPPIVFFLANRGDSKDTFRANLAVWAIIINAITIASFWIGGVINKDALLFLWYLAPSLCLGALAGTFVVGRIEESLFKKIVLTLIVVAGSSALVASFLKLV